jgi:taurine dioxygenase
MTYLELPPKAAILHAIGVPPAGGSTYFADMFAAYETLPEALKNAARGRGAVHDASRNSAAVLRKGYEEVADVRETVGVRHLLTRSRETGRKALFLATASDRDKCRRQRGAARCAVDAYDASTVLPSAIAGGLATS